MTSFIDALKKERMKTNGISLDLHGVKHGQVFKTVDKFIGKHIQKGTNEVYFITGNSPKMKMLVERALDDYELYAEESVFNPGKLVVNLM